MQVRVRDPGGHPRVGTYDGDAVHLGGAAWRPGEVSWLPPAEPSKIVCLARNVAAHAHERDAEVPDRPAYFLKPPSSVVAHRGTAVVPAAIEAVEYEAELAAVVGRQLAGAGAEEAMDALAGLTVMNDLSNRADQRRELNWVRGKAFDAAAPLGPGLVEPSAVPPDADIELRVNGAVRQRGSRDEYRFDLPTVLEDLTRYVTLEPGDIVALGTPAGVGPLADGDEVAITIEGIGTLEHGVRYAE